MNVLIVEDDLTVLSCTLKALKEKFSKYSFYGANNFEDAKRLINDNQEIELAIFDIHLGNQYPKGGLELYRIFNQKYPLAEAIFLTAKSNGEILLDVSRFTQVTFLMKPWHSIQLESVIKMANIKHKETKNLKERLKTLSKRESEVALLLSRGKTNVEIADKLDISSKSIHTYKTRIFNKLIVESTAELYTYFPPEFD